MTASELKEARESAGLTIKHAAAAANNAACATGNVENSEHADIVRQFFTEEAP